MNTFGYVYFAQAGKDGPVKIGSAANPEERIKTLQTGCPQPINLLGFIPSYLYREDERDLHTLFQEHRFNGEWFHPHPTIFKYVQEHAGNEFYSLEEYTLRPEEHWKRVGEYLGYQRGKTDTFNKAKKLMESYNIPLLELCEILKVSYSEAIDA